MPPEEHDYFTEQCLKALEEKFGNRYKITQSWSGSIFFDKKRK